MSSSDSTAPKSSPDCSRRARQCAPSRRRARFSWRCGICAIAGERVEFAARMDLSPILNPLNDAQREAVTAPMAPVLVLAGAGSGKTRVLTHRIAWLITTEGVSPHGVLAVTFTNKAAAEMRGRVEQLLGMPGSALWLGTFHGIAHRLLRMHWREAGLVQSFQILDAEDQLRLIKRLLKSQQLDENRWIPREVQYFINKHKDEGRRPTHLKTGIDATEAQMIKLYAQYEENCARSGVIDFAELLLRAYELWRDTPALLRHYRSRFRHVLVDEFQDTNAIQYAWIRLLVGSEGAPFVVGDDDQSIYRWRGAPVRLFAAYNERDEADFVVTRILDWTQRGGLRREIAILYRSNAQSRTFEEALISARLPYRVYGGLRFFERAEIKDALAYLRLIANRDDDASFERVVNLPPRGIGARTIDAIREAARGAGSSLWRAAANACDGSLGRAANALLGFQQLIERLSAAIANLPLYEQVDHVIQHSGLIEQHQKDKADRGEARVENLLELVSAARGFDPDGDGSPLQSFLAHAVLESGEGQGTRADDCVQMMTLHTAKGLEFPLVFLSGMEDGLFPHQRSINDLEGLEEERRLCYVGMTRAMRQLYFTYAEQRRLHGVDSHNAPSRFIQELPPALIEEVRPRMRLSQAPATAAHNGRGHNGGALWQTPLSEVLGGGMRLGTRVRHGKFGEGTVLNIEGQGPHARVQVNFEQQGSKWLMLQYANLEVM